MLPRHQSARIALGLLIAAFTLGGGLLALVQPVLLKLTFPWFPLSESAALLARVVQAGIVLGLLLAWFGTYVRVWQWLAAILFLARVSVAITLFIGLIDLRIQTLAKLALISTLYGITILLLTMSQVLFPCWLGNLAGWRRFHPLWLLGFVLLGFLLGSLLYPRAVEPFVIIDEQLLWMNIGLTCTGFLYLAVFFLLLGLSRHSQPALAKQVMASSTAS